jgi:hypothetical protein
MNRNDDRVLLVRGFLLGTAGGGNAPPGSGATITILDTPTNLTLVGGVPFARVELNVYSSHDSGASGVVFSSTFDRGTNYRTQSTNTYLNADGPTTYSYLMRGGGVKIAYTNSANVLTAWEMEVWAVFDRNPGS